jgi:four helix bundle protein
MAGRHGGGHGKLTKNIPADERYALVDQVRRSSRSVAANLSEAWRKRRCTAAFKSKLNDAEAEASETQTWIELALSVAILMGALLRNWMDSTKS